MNLDFLTSTELLFMIDQLPQSLKNKIPYELKSELKTKFDSNIYNSFVPDKPFYKQNVSDDALKIFYDIISEYTLIDDID